MDTPICMVCGVGRDDCTCMSPAAFDLFMKVHGERDRLLGENERLRATLENLHRQFDLYGNVHYDDGLVVFDIERCADMSEAFCKALAGEEVRESDCQEVVDDNDRLREALGKIRRHITDATLRPHLSGAYCGKALIILEEYIGDDEALAGDEE